MEHPVIDLEHVPMVQLLIQWKIQLVWLAASRIFMISMLAYNERSAKPVSIRPAVHHSMQYINMHPFACAPDGSNAEPIHCRIQLHVWADTFQIHVAFVSYIRIRYAKSETKVRIIVDVEAVGHDRESLAHIPFIKSRLPCFRINIKSPSSFFHVTRGIGLPVARHVNAASSPSCTAISTDESSFIISGGTVLWITAFAWITQTKYEEGNVIKCPWNHRNYLAKEKKSTTTYLTPWCVAGCN